MIILFDETETKFDSLGLGVLTDATQCTVTEELNGGFVLEMLYSVSGQFYDKLNLNKIIYVKTNPYDEPQPFRISSISKPIKGHVTINAKHISYDTNGIPVTAINATTLSDVFTQIKKNSLVQNNFNFRSDMYTSKSFKTTQPYNLRAILMGDEENSLIGVYDAELKFDKFDIHLLSKRGKNRGAQVCYGQNMTDLTHEINDDKLYNGIFPYYHKESTSTETETEETFKQAYIVGTKEYAEDWLSFSENGEAYHPLDSNPVQIASEGDHYEEVYSWNSTYQKYEKKIYNESVQLLENVISPEWIKIVWSSFPNVKCVANAKGYFKTSTDTDWGDIKGVGDVIFEGNIFKEGLSGLVSNMTIYYSEVIPSTKESTSTEVTEIKEVVLDDPIIWLNTIDSKSMAHDRILLVDLTDKFDDEEPTQEQLKIEAEKYISEYKLGNIVTSTEVSFVEINENQNKYKNFTHIELGDTVQIIYNDINVNTELRVISTNYNVLTDKYSSIELGEKTDTLSSQSVENGDNISSLTNDVGYADITTVNKLIAETVTAEFINAANATLSKAQIEELEVSKIKMPGVIEASQYVIDNLIATMLTAQNAKIAQTLEAGTVKVNGNIGIIGGSIDIRDTEGKNTFFSVNTKGDLTANSVDITGGHLSIGDNFEVTNSGIVTAKAANISGNVNIESGSISIGDNFEVDDKGCISAKSGNIANFNINNNGLYSGTIGEDKFVLVSTGYSETISDLTSDEEEWTFVSGKTFGITTSGRLYSKSGNICGFTITSDSFISNENGAENYKRNTIITSYKDDIEVPTVYSLKASWNESSIRTDTITVYNSIQVTSSIRISQEYATSTNPDLGIYFANNDYGLDTNDHMGINSYKSSNGLVTMASYYGGSGGITLFTGYLSKIPARDIPGIAYIRSDCLVKNRANSFQTCQTNPVIGWKYFTNTKSGVNTASFDTGMTRVLFVIADYDNNTGDGYTNYAISSWYSGSTIYVKWNNHNGSRDTVKALYIGYYN